MLGGPVGPSDLIGAMNFPVVHHICRGPDGYLNKPSKIATPLDLSFQLGFDQYAEGLDSIPFIQNAYSDVSGWRWHYLLSVDLKETVRVGVEDLELKGSHVAWQYFPECWRTWLPRYYYYYCYYY